MITWHNYISSARKNKSFIVVVVVAALAVAVWEGIFGNELHEFLFQLYISP